MKATGNEDLLTLVERETIDLTAYVVSAVDSAIWSARDEFGHGDNFLEDGEGNYLDFHPQALAAADDIVARAVAGGRRVKERFEKESGL